MAGDSGYETSESDLRAAEIYQAARASGLSNSEASNLAAKWQSEAAYAAPTKEVKDLSSYNAIQSDWKGDANIFANDQGIQAVLTDKGYVTPESLNPILKPGEKISKDTLVQAVNDDGLKLYLTDANDPNSRTTNYTGIPAIGGTIGQVAYQPPRNNSVFGTIGSDLAAAARDPYFHNFLAAAAAIAGGGMALNSAFGAGGLGAATGAELAAGATAFPIEMGGLLAPTELGAVGATGSALGTGGMSAAEAIAAAAESGLGAEFGVQGALSGAETLGAAGAGLTDAQATALMESGILPAELQTPALGGLTDVQASALMESGILPAELQVPAQGTILSTISEILPGGLTGDLIKGGLTLGGLAAAQALAPKPSSASTSLSAQELADMVAKMPSAMQQYLLNAQQSTALPQSFVELFPGFSLPTTGPYFGAGRFGDYYAPTPASTTPISPTGLV